MTIGSAVEVPYKLDGTNAVNTRWIILGYNGSIPAMVKYRKSAGSGWKHVWVSSMKNDLLADIAVGDKVFIRAYDSESSDFVYTEEAEITAVSGSFTYGNNCTYSVPTQIVAGGKTYDFCGYNITFNSEALLETVQFDPDASCFLKGTKILMSDGTTKNVEDITYDDVLTVWDFDEGKLGSAKVCWLTNPGYKNDHYYQLTFSDGSILRTTGLNSNHKVYNVDEKYFKGVDKTKVGDRIYSKNGIVTVTDKQYFEEEVEYYNLITSKKINCFADGILTSDRYGNMYPVDEFMKYVKTGRTIRPYSDYAAVGISEYWYDNLRIGEVDETISQTLDYIHKCEKQMRPLPETT